MSSNFIRQSKISSFSTGATCTIGWQHTVRLALSRRSRNVCKEVTIGRRGTLSRSFSGQKSLSSPISAISSSTLFATPNVSSTSATKQEFLDKQSSLNGQLSIIQSKAGLINLNSPKQISEHLYGTSILGGTEKGTLEILLKKNEMDEDKLNLVQLVLEFREIKRQIRMVNSQHTVTQNRLSNKNVNNMQTHFKILNSTPSLPPSQLASYSNQSESKNTRRHKSSSSVSAPEEKPDTVRKVLSNGASTFSTTKHIDSLFDPTHEEIKSQVDPFWLESLHSISKPSARAILPQLHPHCPIGYDPSATPKDPYTGISSGPSVVSSTAGKKGSLLSYVRDQKTKYRDCVILTRVGDFYESFGIDALLLMEHCGLNAMAGKARAGCPIKNVQATLDGLTNAGYKVAVFEEASDIDHHANGMKRSSRGGKARIKDRMLAQIVSPANPIYLYDLVLCDASRSRDSLFDTPSARPFVGIISSAAQGYTIVHISMEERTVRVSEHVTAEAVACRLASFPPADPLIYVPSRGEELSASSSTSLASSAIGQRLPFLPSKYAVAKEGSGSRLQIKVLSPTLHISGPGTGISNIERAKQCIVSAMLSLTQNIDDIDESIVDPDSLLSHSDFVVVSQEESRFPREGIVENTHTHPLYMETAKQLGLMDDAAIPPLIPHLLPDSAPVSTRRFLRRWLLTPPPPSVANAMSNLVSFWKEEVSALPPLTIPPIGKLLSLLRAGQASAQVSRNLCEISRDLCSL